MTIAELRERFIAILAPEDFWVILAHATKKDPTFLLAHPEYKLRPATRTSTLRLLRRRLRHEPVAYILGHKEFYGRDFFVTKHTLIPRPETEHLIEHVLEQITANGRKITNNARQSDKKIAVVDVGTGSGNIIITLAAELTKINSISKIQFPKFIFHATDISRAALAIAKKNAKQHTVSNSITFRRGNLLTPVISSLAKIDTVIIVANLPYLSKRIYRAAQDDVKKFEPRSALISARAGLDHYYRLLDQAVTLPQSITLFLEISPEQAKRLKQYVKRIFPTATIQIYPDLATKDRVAVIRLRP